MENQWENQWENIILNYCKWAMASIAMYKNGQRVSQDFPSFSFVFHVVVYMIQRVNTTGCVPRGVTCILASAASILPTISGAPPLDLVPFC
jgi:hypothetical protein